jgi:hypothetical protein
VTRVDLIISSKSHPTIRYNNTFGPILGAVHVPVQNNFTRRLFVTTTYSSSFGTKVSVNGSDDRDGDIFKDMGRNDSFPHKDRTQPFTTAFEEDKKCGILEHLRLLIPGSTLDQQLTNIKIFVT